MDYLLMFILGWAACDIYSRCDKYLKTTKPEYDADSVDDLVPYESTMPTLRQLAGDTPTLVKPKVDK